MVRPLNFGALPPLQGAIAVFERPDEYSGSTATTRVLIAIIAAGIVGAAIYLIGILS